MACFWKGWVFFFIITNSTWLRIGDNCKNVFFSGRWFAVVCVSFSFTFLASTVNSTGWSHVTEVVWRCGLWLVWWWPVWVFINLSFLTDYNITTATITQNECIYTLHVTHRGNRLVFALFIQLRKEHFDYVHVTVDWHPVIVYILSISTNLTI